MSANGITNPIWFKGPNGVSIPGFVYQDPNKLLAVPTTEFVMTADGVLIPKPVDADGNALMVLKGSITTTPSVATVGTNSVLALAANANRKYASFQNDSDTVIYLMGTNAAVLNQGIRLNANGGTYEMSSAGGNLTLAAVYAISSAANKNLLVREGI